MRFTTVSSCTRRFFKHLNFEFWRMIRYTGVNGNFSWNFTCDSVTLLCTFLTQNQFIDRINVVISAALRHGPLHWRLLVLPMFLNFLYNLFRPEIVQPLPGNSLTSFYPHSFWIYKNFQLKCYTLHCTSYLAYTLSVICYMHLPKLVLDLTQCTGRLQISLVTKLPKITKIWSRLTKL